MDTIPNDITHNGAITDKYTSTTLTIVPESDSKHDEILKEPRNNPPITLSHFIQYGCNRRQCVTVSTMMTVGNSCKLTHQKSDILSLLQL